MLHVRCRKLAHAECAQAKGGAASQMPRRVIPLAVGATNLVHAIQCESNTRWTVAFSSGRKIQIEIATTDRSGFSVVDLSPSGERREHSIKAQ